MARRVLKFKSPRGHYRADACIFWCFDGRFGKLFEKFVAWKKYGHYDPVVIAGGAKTLANDFAGRKFLLEQARISIKLHHAKEIVIVLHSDCGAYGGLAAFGNDPGRELKNHKSDLRRAKAFFRKNLPGKVRIEMYVSDFDGLLKI